MSLRTVSLICLLITIGFSAMLIFACSSEALLIFDYQWPIAYTNQFTNVIAVDSNGNIYVTGPCGVYKYNTNGNLLMSWGECGTGNGQFDETAGIAIDSLNNVYVADRYNNRIQKFDVNGNYIGELYANLPYAVGIDSMNNVYIPRTYSIYKYDSNGNRLDIINIPGSAPQGVAVDIQGNIYVTDMTANKVYKLNSNGSQLAVWGGTQGSGPGEFWAPTGIVTDNADDVYVVDMGNDRIQKFDPDGNFLAMWQTEGGGGSYDNTLGIALSDNKIYVAVSRSNQYYYIQRYTPPLPPHFEFSQIGDHAVNESFSATITAIDAEGNVDTSFNGTIFLSATLGWTFPTRVTLTNGSATVLVRTDSPGSDVRLNAYSNGMEGQSNDFTVNGSDLYAEVWGSVRDGLGNLADNVITTITLTGPIDDQQTSQTGHYLFVDLQPGTYTLKATTDDGRFSSEYQIDLANYQPRKQDLTLFTRCNPGLTPVLLVPGIMGSASNLSVLPRYAPKWDDVAAWPTGFDFGFLDAFDTSMVFHGLIDPGVGWTDLADELYRYGYEFGCTLFPVPYDWRKPVHEVAEEYLKPWIDDAKWRSGSEKVHIIAHSMGGLVSRAYIEGDGYENDVDKFAMVGTPNHGASVAYYVWQGGDPRRADSGLMRVYETISRLQYRVFYNQGAPLVKGDEKAFYKLYHENIPALGELQPTYPFLSGRTLSCDQNSTLIALNEDADRFRMGKANDTTGKIKTKVFAGKGEKTILSIPVGQKKCTRSQYQDGEPSWWNGADKSKVGDGTVPTLSADLDFVDYTETSGKHMGLVSEYLDDLVAFIDPPTIPTSRSLSDAAKTSRFDKPIVTNHKFSLKIQGRALPHLTDPSGKSLGLALQTLLEINEIPNSMLEADNTGVALIIPDAISGTYTLTLHDNYTESFSLILQYQDNTRSLQQEYLAYSHGASQTFTFSLQSDDPDPIVIHRSPIVPQDVIASPESSNTRINWVASTDPDVISYNVYGQYEDEPYMSLLGNTTDTFYLPGDLWASSSVVSVRSYAVSAVKADGSESFLSDLVLNNDRDDDGLTDGEEITAGTDMNAPDSDNDGLTDGEEVWEYDTDPLLPDTDSDTYGDYAEVLNHSDPLDPASVPPFFATSYGGTGIDEGSRIVPTDDGGSILIGTTESFGAGGKDIWLLKLNTDGSIAWQRTYGGVGNEQAGMVQPTPDGGYILVGTTDSFGTEGNDLWLLKLDSLGTIEWQQTYGESYSEDTGDIVWNTDDGGYIVGGSSNSFGPSAFWLLKLDGAGAIQWENVYDKPGKGYIAALQQSIDGGYILAVNNDLEDFWVLKLDSTGGVTWQNTYSDSPQNYTDFTVDWINALQQTTDGGYIVAGSVNTAWSLDNPEEELWILKLDSSGAISWQKKYEGSGENIAYAIRQTDDGGYIVAEGGDGDMSLFKLDASGNLSWRKTYAGISLNGATLIHQTVDGGYLVSASSSAFGSGQSDLFVLKVRPDGTISDCAIGSATSLQVSDTTASGVVTDVFPNSTVATVTISTALSQETLIEPEYVCSQPIPDMYLAQAGQSIPGDSGRYDFGTVTIGTAESITLTIENLGTLDLKLVGSPIIQIIGEAAEDFSITTTPASTIIPGASTTFTMQFAPTLPSSRVATVLIFNNDSNKDPYTFTVTGTGITPEINVKQGATDIQKGGSYTFGAVNVGSSSATITFTIQNTGKANLTLSGIQKTGSHPNDFTVAQPASSTVTPGNSTTFTATFAPTATGTRTAMISIFNNDSDEDTYTFTVTGTGQAGNSYLLWTK